MSERVSLEDSAKEAAASRVERSFAGFHGMIAMSVHPDIRGGATAEALLKCAGRGLSKLGAGEDPDVDELQILLREGALKSSEVADA